MFTFQHIGTARHRDDDYNMTLVLYGRQASGRSVAVTVDNLTAYGYVKGDCNVSFQQYVRTLLQWHLSMQASTRSTAKYRKENNTSKPPAQVFNTWLYFFQKMAVSQRDIVWSTEAGHNIRHVEEGPGPTVYRFETARYNVWRGLLAIMKDTVGTHSKIRAFQREMAPLFYPCQTCTQMPQAPNCYRIELELYETMFQPELVWMVDHNLPACSWMSLTAYTTDDSSKYCDVNLGCGRDSVIPCNAPPIPMAPFRVLSYDIEAMPFLNPTTGECDFPDPKRDSICTIGVCAFDIVSAQMEQTVFVLDLKGQPPCKTLAALASEEQTDEYDPSTTRVCSFTNEFQMLTAFAALIQMYDPDIITGYNVLNFDNVYLIQRIQALCGCHGADPQCPRCRKARTFSRVDYPSTLKKKYTHTNQRGGQESWEAWIEGRDWMDIYRVVMTDHKLRSYKLDNVCEELLGTKKIHIAYEDIPKHQQTPEGRHFLAQYCVKDAWLPCQIIVRRCKLVNALQMAQVTGVPLTNILHRGQQIRTLLLMLRQVKRRCAQDPGHPRWYLPDESNAKPTVVGGFEGAVVITPKPGYYQTPVITLDFASLYPSIMRAYNMCFSTLIPSYSQAQQMQLQWTPTTHGIKDPTHPDYPEVRPVRSFDYPEGGNFEYKLQKTDVCFLTTKKRYGILPEILEQLLNERARVKKMRKKFGEKTMDYAVLDGRQLALKVCANSVYGFTGAGKGYLGEKRIASSVTRVGRGMANHTKFMCEEKYKDHGLEIVYGDTDSVFANIPASMCDTNCSQAELIAKVDKIGTEMGQFCTQAFLPPNDLEYEKFYYPILLKGKKRYAGHKFEPGLAPKLDVKGFECVRRDFAPVVSKTQKMVLIKLCKENDVQGAIEYARNVVLDLLANRVPIEDLTMSKQLTRRPEEYKNPAPHTELAKRLIATQPAHIAPKPGDRIAYLIRPGYRGEKTYQKAVTPEDVAEGRASADTRWYLTNQLQKPLQRIFEMVMDNSDEIFQVTAVHKPQIVSNPMMNAFIQRSARATEKRPSSSALPQRKRVKKCKTMDIKSFF